MSQPDPKSLTKTDVDYLLCELIVHGNLLKAACVESDEDHFLDAERVEALQYGIERFMNDLDRAYYTILDAMRGSGPGHLTPTYGHNIDTRRSTTLVNACLFKRITD